MFTRPCTSMDLEVNLKTHSISQKKVMCTSQKDIQREYFALIYLLYVDLKKRNVILIDVAHDKIPASDYKPEEDPKLYHSEKTGRGPLTDPDWQKKVEPVMTCYKLVYIEFKWFGIQGKVESFLAKTIHNLFTKFHR